MYWHMEITGDKWKKYWKEDQKDKSRVDFMEDFKKLLIQVLLRKKFHDHISFNSSIKQNYEEFLFLRYFMLIAIISSIN